MALHVGRRALPRHFIVTAFIIAHFFLFREREKLVKPFFEEILITCLFQNHCLEEITIGHTWVYSKREYYIMTMHDN